MLGQEETELGSEPSVYSASVLCSTRFPRCVLFIRLYMLSLFVFERNYLHKYFDMLSGTSAEPPLASMGPPHTP